MCGVKGLDDRESTKDKRSFVYFQYFLQLKDIIQYSKDNSIHKILNKNYRKEDKEWEYFLP